MMNKKYARSIGMVYSVILAFMEETAAYMKGGKLKKLSRKYTQCLAKIYGRF